MSVSTAATSATSLNRSANRSRTLPRFTPTGFRMPAPNSRPNYGTEPPTFGNRCSLIADLAGGDWPTRARAAALELSGRGSEVSETIGVELLWGCYYGFGNPEDGEPLDKLPTKDLIAALCTDDEAPWSTWSKGHPITARALANQLGKFGIRSRSIRVADDSTPKGYHREAFRDTWKRYLRPLPPDLSATTPQPSPLSEKQIISIRHTNSGVADEKGPNSAWIDTCGGVADKTGGCKEIDGLQANERTLLADLQQLVDSGEAHWVEP